MLLMSEHYFYSGISIVASKQPEKIEIDTELLENYLNKSLDALIGPGRFVLKT